MLPGRAPLGKLELAHHELLEDVEVRTSRARARLAEKLLKRGESVYREKVRAHRRGEHDWARTLGSQKARFQRGRALERAAGDELELEAGAQQTSCEFTPVENAACVNGAECFSTIEATIRFHIVKLPRLAFGMQLDLGLVRGSLDCDLAPAPERDSLRMPESVPHPETGAPVNAWHAKRALGLLGRFKRMRSCHESNMYLVKECGCTSNRFRLGCGQKHCNRCRKAKIGALVKPFQRARGRLKNEAARKRLRMHERLCTLTTPAVGTADERVDLAFEAWKGEGNHSFAEELRAVAAASAGREWEAASPLTHTFRVFEWTEGKHDGLGNPHFHMWHFGHYMPKKEIQERWTARIEAAAARLGLVLPETFDESIVDVRAAKKGVERELIKYLIKDLATLKPGKHGQFVDAQVLADVLVALEGRRTRQTSSGFGEWAVKFEHEKWCVDCGCQFTFAHFEDERERAHHSSRDLELHALAPPVAVVPVAPALHYWSAEATQLGLF